MKNEIQKFEVIIIGGGPSGLTAGIYSARRGLSTAIISKDIGGQITKTNEIENYPGFDHISGLELSQKMFAQVQKFQAKMVFEEVKKISKLKSGFKVETTNRTLHSKAVILCAGKKPRELGVSGEEEFKGRGVSYCATCDAPFFRDKTVIVVGGGNSALDASIISSKFAKKVYLIHRGPEFRAEEVLINQVKQTKNIEIIFSREITKIEGNSAVESATLNDGSIVKADGIIVEVGYIIDRTLVQGLLDMDKNNQIITNELQETSVKGIFAAGDITTTPYKQIVISAGEGAKAALSCYDYLQKLSGKKGIYADWH